MFDFRYSMESLEYTFDENEQLREENKKLRFDLEEANSFIDALQKGDEYQESLDRVIGDFNEFHG